MAFTAGFGIMNHPFPSPKSLLWGREYLYPCATFTIAEGGVFPCLVFPASISRILDKGMPELVRGHLTSVTRDIARRIEYGNHHSDYYFHH